MIKVSIVIDDFSISFGPFSGWNFPEERFIAFVIAIEKSIRIDQTLIFIFQSSFDFLFSIKP